MLGTPQGSEENYLETFTQLGSWENNEKLSPHPGFEIIPQIFMIFHACVAEMIDCRLVAALVNILASLFASQNRGLMTSCIFGLNPPRQNAVVPNLWQLSLLLFKTQMSSGHLDSYLLVASTCWIADFCWFAWWSTNKPDGSMKLLYVKAKHLHSLLLLYAVVNWWDLLCNLTLNHF